MIDYHDIAHEDVGLHSQLRIEWTYFQIIRQAFFLLFLVIFVNTHAYASEIKGYKVVLASFLAFNEAQRALDVLGARMSTEEAFLEKKYHFEIVARPSGEAFIVVLEPLDSKESAELVLKHFKFFYPDAYTSGYFGPTPESVVWKSRAVLKESTKGNIVEQKQAKNIIPKNPIAVKEAKPSEPIGGYSWVWIFVPSSVLIASAGTVLIRRGKKRTIVDMESSAQVDDISLKGGVVCTKDTHKSSIAKIQSRAKDDLSTLSPWCYEEALKRTGGNTELLDALIQSFIEDAPLMIRDLKESVSMGDFVNTQLRAQMLKSASANIAAAALRVMGKRLEFAARERNSMLIEANLSECERIVNDTLSSLRKCPLHDGVVTKKPCSDDLLDISMTLERLRQNIEKSIFVDTDTLKIFGEYADSITTVLMGDLKKSIEKLEYDKALQIIQSVGKVLK